MQPCDPRKTTSNAPAAGYRVRLFKTLLSSDGHPAKCLQRVFAIARSRSAERAIEAARRRYQHAHRAPDWDAMADVVEATKTEPGSATHER